jgi:hypothetical protein
VAQNDFGAIAPPRFSQSLYDKRTQMLSPILLITAFAFFGLGLCFSVWERKELRKDIEPKERDYWVQHRDKYGPGVSLLSPPSHLLTQKGRNYGKLKWVFLVVSFSCLLFLIVYANF